LGLRRERRGGGVKQREDEKVILESFKRLKDRQRGEAAGGGELNPLWRAGDPKFLGGKARWESAA